MKKAENETVHSLRFFPLRYLHFLVILHVLQVDNRNAKGNRNQEPSRRYRGECDQRFRESFNPAFGNVHLGFRGLGFKAHGV